MVTNNGGESRNKGTKNNGDGKERGTSYRNGEKKDYKSYNKGPRDDDRRNVRNNNDNKGPRDGKKDYRDNKNGGNDRGQRNSFKNNDSRQNNKFGGTNLIRRILVTGIMEIHMIKIVMKIQDLKEGQALIKITR